ncbi:MAG: oligosaccharide flippase family protein [Xanthomonadales bacterium]|nr:oligosaccharide flippase family protein [Xanthomonadales bacterium]
MEASTASATTAARPDGPGLATHFSRYLGGNLLAVVASFISFPVLTRLLDNEQYGILGYFDAWLMGLLAVVKLGTQHSTTRFYPHGNPTVVRGFVASFLLLPLRYSVLAWLLVVAGYAYFGAGLASEVRLVGWCMIGLLLPYTWISNVSALIGIEQRSGLYTVLSVVQRWAEMLAIVGVVVLLRRDAAGAYAARLAIGAAVALWLAWWVMRTHHPRWRMAVRADWLATLPYALPLVANEISGAVMPLLDRVMLKAVLDDFVPVGIFTVGAGLAATLNMLVNQALSVAFLQVSMREFALEGAARVVATKRAALRVMVYAYLMLMAGLLCVGRDFLLMLSGPGKLASAPVFVALGICYLGYGILDLMGSGLLLAKRSRTMLALNLAAVSATIGANLVLIPHFGVTGAVAATFAGYLVLGIGQLACCPRELRAWPEWRPLLTALGLAALLVVFVKATGLFGLESPWLRFIAMAPLALALYAAPVLVLDPLLRRQVLARLGRG